MSETTRRIESYNGGTDEQVNKLDQLMLLYNLYTVKIGSLHHKSRDGLLNIEYDAYLQVWTVELPLYCFDDLTCFSANIDSLLDEAIEHMKKAIDYQDEVIKND